MPWCGWLLHRFGSRAVASVFASACAFALLVVAFADTLPFAIVAMLLFGGLIGGMDVAMNANAVAVEKRLRRAVMSSSHGFWSLGGFVGGALGGIAILRYGFFAHAVGVTIVTTAIICVALFFLVAEERVSAAQRPPYRLPRQPIVYLTGIIALLSMVPEGAVLDWAALYLRQELGSDIAVAGFAYAAFSATMAAMRFLGDGVRNRFGAVATLRGSALVAAAGMFGAGIAPDPWLAVAAFAVSGIGCANMVPIAFSAAGNHDGGTPGAGLSTVTLMGYSGILAAPSLIGFIGERTGFAPIFVALALLLVAVAMMAGLARAADFQASQPAQ